MSTYNHCTGQAPSASTFYMKNRNTHGAAGICVSFYVLTVRKVLTLSKSGGLAATFTGGRFMEVRERESKKWRERCPGVGSWDGIGVSWGLPSSPCQNSGAQPRPHLKPGSTDKSLSPTPGSPKMSMWSQQSLAPGVWIREECVPAGSSVASLAQVAFIQVSTLATPQTGRWGQYFD